MKIFNLRNKIWIFCLFLMFIFLGSCFFSVQPARAQQIGDKRLFPAEPQTGGFVMQVKIFKGQKLDFKKTAGETSELKQKPVAYMGLDNVDITGLVLYKNLTLENGQKMNICLRTKNPTDLLTVRKGKYERDFSGLLSEFYGKRLEAGIFDDNVPVIVNEYWNTRPEADLFFIALGKLKPSFAGDIVKMRAHVLNANKLNIKNLIVTAESGHRVGSDFGSPHRTAKISDSVGITYGPTKTIETISSITKGLLDDLMQKLHITKVKSNDNLTEESDDVRDNMISNLNEAAGNIIDSSNSVNKSVYKAGLSDETIKRLEDAKTKTSNNIAGNILGSVEGLVNNLVKNINLILIGKGKK